MKVPFWDVGSSSSVNLPFTPNEISSHLIADWMPSIPASMGMSLLRWPESFISTIAVSGTDYLTLNADLGQCERQWKGFLSWMLGVAGARQVLHHLGYRWIAPCSAFYPDAKLEVAINWHRNYPREKLVIEKASPPTSTLRPDYIALGSSINDQLGLCIAEAKGSDDALAGKNVCPPSWHRQVRNVRVLFGGIDIPVSRHLVIATRVCPNNKRPHTRRLQIRAWNSQVDTELPDFFYRVPVVVAHLVGLFRNLDHTAVALQLLEAAYERVEYRVLLQLGVDEDLEQEARSGIDQNARPIDVPEFVVLRLLDREFEISISKELRVLTKSLISATDSVAALRAVVTADQALDGWLDRNDWDGSIPLPYGITVRMK